MPQVASTGASVSVADFDRDGWQDFYVTNSAEDCQNRLYRNNGDGHVHRRRGAARRGRRESRRHRRLDGRGVGRLRQRRLRGPVLYKYGRPSCSTTKAARASRRWASGPGCRRGSTPTAPSGSTTTATAGSISSSPATGPTTSTSGSSRRRGSCRRASSTRTTAAASTCCATAATARSRTSPSAMGITQPPLDAGRGGRRPARHRLSRPVPRQRLRRLGALRQRGRQALRRRRPRATGVGRTPKSGMNASFGDIFNDGRLSIYKTNISEPGVLVQGNDLWVPKAAAGGSREYDNLAPSLGVDLGGWSWGAQFGDLNNDGTLDLYLVNGYVSAGERSSYWYDFSRSPSATARIIGDARELAGDARPQPLRLSAQARVDERRRSAASPTSRRASAPPTPTTAARWRWPIWQPRRARRHRREPERAGCCCTGTRCTPGRHWIEFELEGTREQPQRDRRARRACTGTAARRCRTSAAASGFSAQNQRRLHFGLGRRAGGRSRRRSAGRRAGRRRSSGPRSTRCTASRSRMTELTGVAAARPLPNGRQWLPLDNRFLPPLLITCILLTAHLSFGILEGLGAHRRWRSRPRIVAEMALGRITYGKWPHPASAYITGISVGILRALAVPLAVRPVQRSSRSSRSTCCGSAAGTSGTRRTSA